MAACVNEVCVVQDSKKINSWPIDFEGTSIAAHPTEADVAVGGAKVKH